jgi:acyl-CoA synthetase (NDP forming)
VPALVNRARRNGLRIIGPSSMGIASPRADTRLQAALVEVDLPSGGLAMSMQSGSLGGSFLRKAREVDLGVSWFVSLGDKSDISANDLLQFWEQDDNTTVIAMYTESFGNPRKFARIARRVSRTKPIVAVRTGSAATGQMGGALYQQAGLIEVPTVPALLETVRVMSTQPVLDGPRVAVITNSRSPGTLARAALESAGLEPVDGPVVLDWSARAADYPDAILGALASDDIDGLMVIYAPAVVEDVDAAARDIDAAASGASKPVIAVLLGGADGPVSPGSRVPAFTFPEQAAAAFGRSYAYARWRRNEADAPPEVARPVNPAAAHAIISEAVAALAGGSGEAHIDQATKRRLLETYGIAMARSTETDPEHAMRDAHEIGFPVAIKAVRRRPGRSARAGVALDLTRDDDITDAIATMSDSLGDDANELIVQAMTAPGVDVRIRCEHDDRLGAIVSVGLGGAQADAIDDRTSRLAPVSPASAATMLTETRLTAALDAAGFDSSALVDAVVAAAQLASDHPEITELDLNPVIVSDAGAVVTDAVVRLTANVTGESALRRLD